MVHIDNRDTGPDEDSNAAAFIIGGIFVVVLLIGLGWFGFSGGFSGGGGGGGDINVTAEQPTAPTGDLNVTLGGGGSGESGGGATTTPAQ